MKSESVNKGCIIFDTNSLYRDLNKYRDFSYFWLPNNFNKSIELLSEYSLEEYVDICIPFVVWRELEKQTIEKYEENTSEIKRFFKKSKLPLYELKIDKEADYRELLKSYIRDYKDSLTQYKCRIYELPLPGEDCFSSVVERAFEKKSPFSGKDGESDKGLKDVLIWESIIELLKKENYSVVVFFTRDRVFKSDGLKKEIEELFPNIKFYIPKDIEELDVIIRRLSKNIYGDQIDWPQQFKILEEARQWVDSDDFKRTVKELEPFTYVDSQFGEPYALEKRVYEIDSVEYDGLTIEEDAFIVNCVLSVMCKYSKNAPWLSSHIDAKIHLTHKNNEKNEFIVESIEALRI